MAGTTVWVCKPKLPTSPTLCISVAAGGQASGWCFCQSCRMVSLCRVTLSAGPGAQPAAGAAAASGAPGWNWAARRARRPGSPCRAATGAGALRCGARGTAAQPHHARAAPAASRCPGAGGQPCREAGRRRRPACRQGANVRSQGYGAPLPPRCTRGCGPQGHARCDSTTCEG